MKLLYVLPVLLTLPISGFAETAKKVQNTGQKVDGYIGLNLNYVGAQLNDAFGEYFSYVSGYDVDTDDLINPNNFGFSLNAGVQFSKYFGLEAFLQHTFNSTAEVNFYNVGTKVSNYKSKINSWGFGIDALGYIPITDTKFSFIGSVGVGYYTFNAKFDVVNYVYSTKYSDSDDESNLAFRIGFGGQYDFSDRWTMRGIIRYVALNSDDEEDTVESLVDVSLGVKYTF